MSKPGEIGEPLAARGEPGGVPDDALSGLSRAESPTRLPERADIVIVEDEEVLRRSLTKALDYNPEYTVRAAASAEEGLRYIDQSPPDVLITDHRLPGTGGHELLRRVKQEYPDVTVIVITGHGTIEDAVAAMREGAADYLRKPLDLDELQIVVDRCLERDGLNKELNYYRSRNLLDGELVSIVGDAPATRRLRSLIGHVAALTKKDGTGPTVLVTGEMGSGKRLVARALHSAAVRRDAPFIEVDCAADSNGRLEAELLGYEKRTFSDGARPRSGMFEAADTGTIFFQEVGNLSMDLQATLATILEAGVVRRLGSVRDRSVRPTVVASTHRQLDEEAAMGRFREDLYHQLNVVHIEVPALRDREGDKLLLAEHFLRMHARKYGVEQPALARSAVDAIEEYPWPGNVRELSYVIERALLTSPGKELDDGTLGLYRRGAGELPGSIAEICQHDFAEGPISLREVEVMLMRRALAFSGNRQSKAADLLGISRFKLRYWLKKYDLL